MDQVFWSRSENDSVAFDWIFCKTNELNFFSGSFYPGNVPPLINLFRIIALLYLLLFYVPKETCYLSKGGGVNNEFLRLYSIEG